ncbi:major facilitator superfamily domain-containing protein [Cercophora newfieldiana]|uniref:Major facilitator superfamily domain-containing protein n=1 Tax=Cercophora newfieldiana TaxID=92897 RepID=A0AA39YLK1_9PEZI|nr:major facilitator superfamily domain-containing protein [Cercophora newfieldiana]
MATPEIEAARRGDALDVEETKRPFAEPTVAHYKPITDEEKGLDKSINRKLDFTVLLVLAIGFILCGIDKTNVGFVATSTFVQDANLDPDDIPNSLSLFSATYVPLQPIMVLLGRRIGPRIWLSCSLLSWGILSMAHAGIKNSGTLIALRLLLGAAESGFTQTAFYYMSTMYPKFSVGFRMGMFSGMYSIAGAFAGLIAYGLLKVESSALHGWQVVFLVEGGFTVFMAVVGWFVFPADISTAWFLNERERAHAVNRMGRDLADGQEEGNAGSRIAELKRDVVDVLKDWKKLLTIVCNITAVVPVTAFTTFLPLIVQAGMGYSGVEATLMSVPPFIVGTVGLIIIVYSSDYFHERSLHTVFGMLLGVIGCAVMAASSDPQLRYGFAHVCLAGVFVGGPLVAVWLSGNTPWKGARSFVLGLNGYANLAGVIAGQLFKTKYRPSYRFPLIVTIIMSVVGMAGFVFIRLMYMYENRKRRREISTWDEDRFEEEQNSTERRGDQRTTWIYGY